MSRFARLLRRTAFTVSFAFRLFLFIYLTGMPAEALCAQPSCLVLLAYFGGQLSPSLLLLCFFYSFKKAGMPAEALRESWLEKRQSIFKQIDLQ